MIDLGKAISQLVHERTDRSVEIKMAEGYPGDSARRLPDLIDAKESLGWSAITTLDSGLRQTLDSML
jgi:nucleoside-diphosphate-sugar epimerase